MTIAATEFIRKSGHAVIVYDVPEFSHGLIANSEDIPAWLPMENVVGEENEQGDFVATTFSHLMWFGAPLEGLTISPNRHFQATGRKV